MGIPWTTEPLIQPCVVGFWFNSLTMFWKCSPVFLAPGAKKPRGWVILTPRINRARPFPAGLGDLEPFSEGNVATLRGAITVDN